MRGVVHKECGVAGTVVSVSVKAEIYFYDCVTDGRLRLLWVLQSNKKKEMADQTP